MAPPVTIHRGEIEATSELRDVPRAQWTKLLRKRQTFVHSKCPYACRMLLRFVEDAAEMAEPMGFAGTEDFLRRGLDIDPQLVAWAVAGLKTLQPEKDVTLDFAVSAILREQTPVEKALAAFRELTPAELDQVRGDLAEALDLRW